MRILTLFLVLYFVVLHAICAEDITVSESSISSVEALSGVINVILSEPNPSIKDEDTNKIISYLKSVCKGQFDSDDTGLSKSQFIEELIGKNDYDELCALYARQLDEKNVAKKQHAIKVLGDLYFLDAQDKLKECVFGGGPYIQFAALVSLVKLETPDSRDLLASLLLSGTVPDIMVPTAIDALYSTDADFVANIAPTLIERNPTILTIEALLPALGRRDDSVLFLSDILCSKLVSNSISEDGLNNIVGCNAVVYILREIEDKYDKYIVNMEVADKIDYLARHDNQSLWLPALLLQERAGKDISYFRRISEDSSDEKKKEMDAMIKRISDGKRLKFEKP